MLLKTKCKALFLINSLFLASLINSFDFLAGDDVDYFNQRILDSKILSKNAIILYFSGTYFELGRKMGKIYKDCGLELKKIMESDKENVKNYLNYIGKFHPGLLEYQKGIAETFNVNYEKEKYNYNFNPAIFNIDWFGCSGLFVSSKKSTTSKNYIARNFDFMDHKYNFQVFRIKGVYEVICHTIMLSYTTVMDGINNQGLCIELNLVTSSVNALLETHPKYDYPAIEVSHLIRIILESCKNVNEAIIFLNRVNVYFAGPEVHLLIGDKNGNSAVVEFDRKDNYKPIFIKGKEKYQVMTNFNISNKGYKGNMGYMEGSCIRYKTLEDIMQSTKNNLIDENFINHAIQKVIMKNNNNMTQGMDMNTRVSMLYDLNEKKVHIRLFDDDFKKIYTLGF